MFIHEDYFKNIFNTVREAILILDQEMRVISANRSFFKTFQVDAADTIGSLLYDLGNGQWNIPELRTLLEDILPKNDTVDDYEIDHKFESIGQKTMLLNACKIREEKSSQPIILLAIEDITRRKELEDLLTESELRYRRIFETASDGILLLEKSHGEITHANPAAEQMLGYTREELIGKRLQEIGVKIESADFPAVMAALEVSGILNYDDVQVRTRSGETIATDIYMVDRATLAQCNIRDVSQRKRAEKALKEEKAFIDNALNMLRDIFFAVDRDGKFLRWNRAMKLVSGYSDKEISLMKPADFFREDSRERVARALRETEQKGCSSIDAILVSKGGKEIPHEFKTSLLKDQSGKVIGISGVGRDLSERKKLETQLFQSQKMEAVGTLAGGIAHDFNNILNVILGYGTLVVDKLEAGSTCKEQMNEVLIAAERAADITKRLLIFSRKQIVEMKPVNINDLIVGLQKMLVQIIRESIDIHLNLTTDPLIVLADAGQLEQVLINLAANARDAMKGGGRLSIDSSLEVIDRKYAATYGVGKPGRYALITVSDSGQGMDSETQSKIFEPFFTTKGIGAGTGLGLSISYGIIKQHNGYIKVYSETGHGSIFKIYLPLSDEVSPAITAESVTPTIIGGHETLLVAEDDISLRKFTRVMLESYGYTVISAADGEEAIIKFEGNEEQINLVLLDMIMPRKNGKEVSEAMKRIRPQVKILYMSGYTMDIIQSEDLLADEIDFIQKPYQPIDLLKKVRELLDKPDHPEKEMPQP